MQFNHKYLKFNQIFVKKGENPKMYCTVLKGKLIIKREKSKSISNFSERLSRASINQSKNSHISTPQIKDNFIITN